MQYSPLDPTTQSLIDDASEWALMHGLALKTAPGMARHCPFSLAPVSISRSMFTQIKQATPVIARLIERMSEDHVFLQQTLSAMGQADPFFGHLLRMHRRIHGTAQQPLPAQRLPLLMMRTDFMDDRVQGPKVIEFNGIAAGMAPFGQRIQQLHSYLRQQWPQQYGVWAENAKAKPAINDGLQQMAAALARTARKVRDQAGESGAPRFLMVVQEGEDNVFDQHLLTQALQAQGIQTLRRTFRQLHGTLVSGDHGRLLLDGVGGIDVVYLRAGYQYSDYCASDLEERACCEALIDTRAFIEQHRVAVNATVGQQLATSKSIQLQISQMTVEELGRWGLNEEEAALVLQVMAPMKSVTAETASWFEQSADPEQWVLKNQGEGGGHCLFDSDILPKLKRLKPIEQDAWALMRRLHPHERDRSTLAVRDGKERVVSNLISELGLFTVHFQGQPMTADEGYCGYLVRSKPATASEGGVHSGDGLLDSLTLVD